MKKNKNQKSIYDTIHVLISMTIYIYIAFIFQVRNISFWIVLLKAF